MTFNGINAIIFFGQEVIFLKSRAYEIDMTNGTIMDKLISFSLPLMLSSVLQLLFNAVDIIVVGRFSGRDSLAAVGATTALINVFINLFIGISLGANVMTARYVAQKDDKKTSDTVHTAITVALISGFAMAVVGWFCAYPALRLMDTPDDIISKSVLYMRIYFMGMPFFMLYNYGAAILRAVGDTKRPLIYLIISGCTNAVLNMILVTVFNLDVAGVASATAVSQMISCVLVLRCLVKTKGTYRLDFKALRINGKCLADILKVGLPAGIQSTVINLSNALLQSSVNTFGSIAMAGYTAANNIFGFLFVTVNSISQACMSFTSQNYGAGKPKRMDRVLVDCLILEVTVPLAMGTLVYIFGHQVLGIYTNDADVIKYGMEVLAYTTVTYFICGIMDLIPGAMRGMGYSAVPMILSILGTVGTRILWIYGFFPSHRTLSFLFISYPASWLATVFMQGICFFFVRKNVIKKLKESPAGSNTY